MTNVDAPTTGLGELSGLLASWRLHLEAANLSPRTIRAYTDDGALFAAYLAGQGMPTVAGSIPEKPVPVLADGDVKRLVDSCAGKDFRDRRDLAIIRLFLDTGVRLEGMGGLCYNPDDPDLSDVDLRSRVVRVIAKGG